MGFGGKLVGPVEYMANLHYATFGGWRRMSPQRLSGIATLGATLGKSRVEVAFGLKTTIIPVELGAAPYMPGDMVDMATDKVVMRKGDRHQQPISGRFIMILPMIRIAGKGII